MSGWALPRSRKGRERMAVRPVGQTDACPSVFRQLELPFPHSRSPIAPAFSWATRSGMARNQRRAARPRRQVRMPGSAGARRLFTAVDHEWDPVPASASDAPRRPARAQQEDESELFVPSRHPQSDLGATLRAKQPCEPTILAFRPRTVQLSASCSDSPAASRLSPLSPSA
jgi:hypothetical protein